MDPLSASSGFVGLLAFALEIAKMARAARMAIERFKSAPRETKELVDRLAVLETVCHVVEAKLAAGGRRLGDAFTPLARGSLAALSTALARCELSVKRIGLALDKCRPVVSGGRRSVSSIVSRARFVLSREKTRALVRDVEDATGILHLVLSMDTW